MVIISSSHKVWPLFLVVASLMGKSTSLVISTAQGRLRGVHRDGHVSYLGIPYASISSPFSRFKGAGLAPTWQGVRESDQRHCTAYSPVEDCLHLDVHTPSSADSPWPVMVWVRGSSGQYNPGKLVKQSIVVVIVSHRMGPAGFLCMKDERIPGNAGAKDVVLALRWVRDNIVAFKGNPYKVVVAGQGFGAAMVEAIILSSMGDGLYHGAILQSGSILSPWAFNYDATARGKTLARILSNDDDSIATLLNTTIEELASKSEKLDVPYFPFGMCIEKYLKNEELLIGESPYEMMKRKGGSVPMIVGYNSDEAYVFASVLTQSNVEKRMSDDLSFLLPEEMKFMKDGEVAQVARQIQDAYFKDNHTLAAVLAYHRDAYFVNHIYRSVRRHSSAHSPVFFYQFSHVGDAGVLPEPGVDKIGAAFSDELAYLFTDDGRELEGRDKTAQENLIRIWTNFVKYLHPSPHGGQWQQMEPSAPSLLDIDHELKMKQFPHARTARAWDDIYDKFYYNRHRSDE
ncbi:carboxylesterase 5A-like [Plodia interpunctella]|uniref:carboxylesterase 5A-like n=1 Tax=Plodia interpunctella TaxID=58824 RepID=UPI00236750D1|nr:carboxylesterase 5A-like [Plodia interpunctella]